MIRRHPSARRLLVSLAGVVLACALATPAVADVRDPTPLYAHYYIWFNPSSWNRAKVDYPLLGRYSSDEETIMRRHIEMAKEAGIDGFIVSWKSTEVLDARLAKLIEVAREKRFRLAIVYQGLDFERRPLPVEKVELDLDLFARRFASSPVFDGFGKPMIIWSGTWKFTPEEIERVHSQARGKLQILATERNAKDYLAKASVVDGNAYYWSSVNPETYPDHPGKLQGMSAAVHEEGGLWFAPAAPGFDARLVGGRTVVDRKGGDTLRKELEAAQSSQPDAIALISWNEFSENTHVEPSTNHGSDALEVIADVRGTHFEAKDEIDSSNPAPGGGWGPGAVSAIVGFGLLMLLAVVILGRRSRAKEMV